MTDRSLWKHWHVPQAVSDLLSDCPSIQVLENREDILALAMMGKPDSVEISYDIPGKGTVVEATVSRCNNGLVINYPDAYMRRRDPDCMLIGDDGETDKTHFNSVYPFTFSSVRNETFAWLRQQKLAVLAISIGGPETGLKGLFIGPQNAGFFIGGVADLQGIIPIRDIPRDFHPAAIVYLAPPFRHTHFDGKQLVVHHRLADTHEVFSYNLYPGPSAKKGVYGVLLGIGEKEGWLTLHASTVQVETPYENITTILHEGASGSGKSEMLEYPHREQDGRLLLGINKVSGEKLKVSLNQSCLLKPLTDDMALTFPKLHSINKKLMVYDAEMAWFIRMNHITHYGTDPDLESITIHPSEPLIFFNISGVPHSTSLIWEHTEDTPGIPCPNPRVILPRKMIPNVLNEKAEVDYRSFGIRTPVCTAEVPSFGIFGLLHILPPALAWIWRLAAPRGAANPSIVGKDSGLISEGVGSYWPFATGKKVNHANILLQQILETSNTRYILFPNQHIGAWQVGFMPQWLSREYLARKGAAKFQPSQLINARSPLLGYIPHRMMIEGASIPEFFFEVNKQEEVTDEGYDQGARILQDYLNQELSQFMSKDLDPLGRQIIQCCIDHGGLEDYIRLIPMTL